MTGLATRTWLLTAVVLLVVAAVTPVHGAEGAESQLTIEQAVMARQIEEREPVGEATVFPTDVGQVSCYTKVLGATGETYIEHVWFRDDVESARVRLPVRSPAWRTWSSKRIRPDWTGKWTVRIEDAEGRVLDTLNFTIGESAEPHAEG